MNANDPFWSDEEAPQSSDLPEAVKAAAAPEIKRLADGSVDQNAVVAATIANHEERGAEYYRLQYEALQQQFNSVNRYTGIINRLESDPNLVDVLERSIAGEVLVARGVDNKSLFDDDDDDDADTPRASTKRQAPRDPAQDMSPEQIREQARREGEMQAAAQMELKGFLGRLATEGVPAYLQDKFVKFTNNPNGLTVGDMYAAFLSMEERSTQNAPPVPPVAPKREGPAAVTVSAIGGSTDRPGTERNISQTQNGVRFINNPNDIVPA